MAKKKTAAAPKKTPRKTPGAGARPKDEEIRREFPIVGIGASAGGLEAFEQFFTNMPPDSGIAFVLVQHLDPTHKSILTELLSRYTPMRVVQIEDAMLVEPNTVFVIPPNRYLAILNGKLLLLEPTQQPGLRAPIDYFFRSLAEDQKERAICIVLSGTGTEGAMGLRAVKGEGGMGMVQTPESAKYDGMPKNAIATGLADYILPPREMPEQLISYVGHTVFKLPGKAPEHLPKESELLDKVFVLVRSQTGHDFSQYKHNTILRRIDRRMAVHQLTRLSDYVRYMQEEPREADTLFKDLLIGVTSFFRDAEAFEALKEKAISQLFATRSPDQPVRIWVAGCATGEEAYGIAMMCRDVMDGIKRRFNVQIFATDIDNDAVAIARQGIYPASISVDIPPEFLSRFFTKDETLYRVNKDIRDMVVFAVQNVIADPPFSKIDLISCRNLLIYLNAGLQRKVLPLFHYALRKDGFLFLGSSETIGELSDYFTTADRKWKLFRRADALFEERPVLELAPRRVIDRSMGNPPSALAETTHRTNLRQLAEGIILDNYGPTAAVINEKNEILFIHGRAGNYLEPPAGDFTGDILAMAREGLRLELGTAMRKASRQKMDVRIERLSIRTNGEDQLVNLVVKPISQPASMKGTLMVIFEDVPEDTAESKPGADQSPESQDHPRVRQLEQELRSTKEYLQATIEELETSNEELKSTNEELQSSNEELQSTNEELETSKEELQSVNEELTTVNSEHQQKIEELSKTSSDLNNLLSGTGIGTVFLDRNLNIQRFTPSATHFINLIQTDIGRPVSHIVSNIDCATLVDDAKEVLRTLVPIQVEVKTKDHRWYEMRILPYRTIQNVIDGVVVTFTEITRVKKALEELDRAHRKQDLEEEARRQLAGAIVNTVRHPFLVLSANFKVAFANPSFYAAFQVEPDETEGVTLYDLGNGQWDIPALRELLEKILPDKTVIEDFWVEHEFAKIGRRVMMLNAARLETAIGSAEMVLLAIEDVTDVKTGQG